MKLTAIILLSACLTASAHGFSQTATLSEKNAPLGKIFTAIERQTGYVFFFDEAWLKQANKVSIEVKNAPLEKVLDICFSNQPLTYTIVDKTIVVKLKEDQLQEKLLPPPIDIKGRIVNEDGSAVAANIVVKGTQNGTTSDNDGYFELKGVDENATLIITGVSIETREIKVAGKNDLTISVKIVARPLEETVVKGYYTTTKKLNTGNVSKTTFETIAKQPVTDPLQALIGRMPGVYINQTSGLPGAGIKIRIRGINSLRDANNPLYIIDGVPFPSTSVVSNISEVINQPSPLNNINPSDIESIEILKDADATAIYGSRGSNGVVLITTKKGKIGKATVDINIYSGFGEITNSIDLLNTQQYLEMRREAFRNDGVTPTNGNAPDLLLWDTTRYTDWQEKLIGGTAHVTDAQVGLSGGTSNTQYLIRSGYNRSSTVFPGDFSNHKSSVHFNLNHSSDNRKFRTSFNGSYVTVNSDLPRYDFTSRVITLVPVAPAIYDANGNLNWQNSTWQNPFAELLRKYKSNTYNLIGNAIVSYEIIPGLNLKTSLAYNKIDVQENKITPIKSQNPANVPTGSNYSATNLIKTWIIEPQAEYQKNIGKGRLSALIGASFQESLQESQVLFAGGYTSDALLENLSAASSVQINSVGYSQYRYSKIHGRVNYNLKEKYLFNLTASRDGSSRFGSGNQFANFGAVGIGWIFSSEEVIKNSFAFLSYGKLRGSYGITGSDQIGDYQYLASYIPTEQPYGNSIGLVPSRLSNPDYSWETTKQFEGAIELGFWGNDLLISASYYRKRTSDQLVGLPLPLITGQSSIQFNFPAVVQNTGWEFEMSSTNIKSKNFLWTSSANLTFPRNKLVSYPDISGSAYANTYEVGKSLFVSKRFHFLGVDPQTGLYQFQDVDGNGSGTDYPQDLQSLKERTQQYFGGLLNSIQYKQWQVDLFFQFVKQTGSSYFAAFYNAPGTRDNNQPVFVMDRWQKPGDIATTQKFTQTGTVRNLYSTGLSYGDHAISDASFIRWKNLAISYSMPEKWSERLKLQRVKIYLQGQNLFTITNYEGFDPETQSDPRALPTLKMITFGIQVTF